MTSQLLDVFLYLQNFLFPIANVISACFSIAMSIWHLRTHGRMPLLNALILPTLIWFSGVYIVYLAGWLPQVPAVYLRGPVAALLLFPGLVALMRVRNDGRIQFS